MHGKPEQYRGLYRERLSVYDKSLKWETCNREREREREREKERECVYVCVCVLHVCVCVCVCVNVCYNGVENRKVQGPFDCC